MKKRAKNRSGVPKVSRAQPQTRRPLTSLRPQANPSTGRLGCSMAGRPTPEVMPSQLVTAATSPKGTPVWAMPHGPGFMPSKTTSLGELAEPLEILPMGVPGVVKRVVDMANGFGVAELPNPCPQPVGDRDQIHDGGPYHRLSRRTRRGRCRCRAVARARDPNSCTGAPKLSNERSSFLRPRYSRDITVPTGTPSRSAVSWYDMPCRSTSKIAIL